MMLTVGNVVFLEQRQEFLLKGGFQTALLLLCSFSRPFGNHATRDSPPNVETLGYSRQSLRDRGNPSASEVVKPSAWLLFCPARLHRQRPRTLLTSLEGRKSV